MKIQRLPIRGTRSMVNAMATLTLMGAPWLGPGHYPIDHRLGGTLLAKCDKAQAKVAYERFIANKRSRPANVEEVRKSLAKLG